MEGKPINAAGVKPPGPVAHQAHQRPAANGLERRRPRRHYASGVIVFLGSAGGCGGKTHKRRRRNWGFVPSVDVDGVLTEIADSGKNSAR